MPQVTVEMPEFFDLSEAARKLDISRPTLYKRMRLAGVRPTRIAGAPYLSAAEIEQLRPLAQP